MAYSYVTYLGTGSLTNFTFPFQYLDKNNISVTVDGNPVSFTWLNDSTVVVSPAPAVDTKVIIGRQTEKSTLLVDFNDGSVLTERDLDTANRQVFFMTQESLDNSEKSLTEFNQFVTQAGDYSEAAYVSERLANDHKENASDSADAAAISKDLAGAYANQAMTASTNVDNQAIAAAASATAASGSATAAATSATEAATSASSVGASVTTATTKASEASASATAAANSASAASGSASTATTGASTATTQASNASTSATNAAASAANAAGSATAAASSASSASTSATAASTSATTATAQATAAASSATASAASATAAASSAATVSKYQGPQTSNPTLRADGSALQAGDLYFNTVASEMRVYNGTVWQAQAASPDTMVERSFTATAGQTSYTFSGGYRVGYTYVYVNGVLLDATDIVATNGTTVTFNSALAAGDEVRMLSFKAVGTVAIGDISGLQTSLDSKAATASLATVATTGAYGDLTGKPTIPTVPTNVSAFTNDSGYLTSSGIKTVNGTSLVGSGNLAIASGGMTLLATVTPANGVTSVNVTGLASSKQLIVIGDSGVTGVTLSAASSIRLKLSVDNGSTFSAFQTGFSSSNINPNGLLAIVYNSAVNGQKRIATFVSGGTGFGVETDATVNAGTVNAIQIKTDDSATFTGVGTFWIYGIN